MLVLAVDLGSEVWRCQVETRSFGLAWIINGKSNPAFTLTATHQRGWKSFIFNKRRRCTVMGSWAMWSWREKESLPELNFTQIRSKVMWWLQRQQEIVALLFFFFFRDIWVKTWRCSRKTYQSMLFEKEMHWWGKREFHRFIYLLSGLWQDKRMLIIYILKVIIILAPMDNCNLWRNGFQRNLVIIIKRMKDYFFIKTQQCPACKKWITFF